jgi:hypothetical protein
MSREPRLITRQEWLLLLGVILGLIVALAARLTVVMSYDGALRAIIQMIVTYTLLVATYGFVFGTVEWVTRGYDLYLVSRADIEERLRQSLANEQRGADKYHDLETINDDLNHRNQELKRTIEAQEALIRGLRTENADLWQKVQGQ